MKKRLILATLLAAATAAVANPIQILYDGFPVSTETSKLATMLPKSQMQSQSFQPLVTYGGYAVTCVDADTVSDALSILELQPYWGSSSYAEAVAASITDKLGYPNTYLAPNDEAPLFLYGCDATQNGLEFLGWAWFQGAVCPAVVQGSNDVYIGSLSAVPDVCSSGMLLGAAALAIVAFRRVSGAA